MVFPTEKEMKASVVSKYNIQSPLPVRLLGWIAIVMGVWFLFSTVISRLIFKQSVIEPTPTISLSVLASGLGGFVLYILCGIGLLKLRNWARYGFIALMAWLLPYACTSWFVFVYRLLQPGGVLTWHIEIVNALLFLPLIVLPFYVFWVLTRPGVKDLFVKKIERPGPC